MKIKSTYHPKGVRIDYISYPIFEDPKPPKNIWMRILESIAKRVRKLTK